MTKPVNKWEAIMWASVAVMLVGAVITAVVHDNLRGVWVLCVTAGIVILAAVNERRRVLHRDRD